MYAMCAPLEPSIIGRRCSLFIPDMEGLVEPVFSLLNAQRTTSAFCGEARYNADGSVRTVEWYGVCQRGVCKECGDYGAFITHYPNIVCGDRMCVAGRFTQSKALFFSWTYFTQNPVVMSTVLIMCVLVVLAVGGGTGCTIAYIKRSKLIAWIRRRLLEEQTE